VESKKYLFILNDAPYGSERVYNGLRLAVSLAKREGVAVRIFLLGDAVLCGLSGQVTPNGYYNIERMLTAAIRRGAEVGSCGTCLEARGMHDKPLVHGVRIPSQGVVYFVGPASGRLIVYHAQSSSDAAGIGAGSVSPRNLRMDCWLK